jgi:hypothetical protein
MIAHIAYRKYQTGDIITDDELLDGYQVFRDVADALIELGPVFSLASDECHRVVDKFREYIDARGLTLP